MSRSENSVCSREPARGEWNLGQSHKGREQARGYKI